MTMPKQWTTGKYDGRTEGFEDWDNAIKATLGPLKLHACLLKEDYYGIKADGKRISLADLDTDDVGLGLDTQSAVSMWLAGSLSGTAYSIYSRMCKECEFDAGDKDRDGKKLKRLVPTAFDLYQAIKTNVKPAKSQKIASGMLRDFASQDSKLPSNASHDDAVKWFEGKLELRNELVLKGQYMDEGLSVTLLMECMSLSKEQKLTLENVAADPEEGNYTLDGLRAAIEILFPPEYKVPGAKARGGALHFQSTVCPHCDKTGHSPDRCWHNPDQTCNHCGLPGHHERICQQKAAGVAAANPSQGKQRGRGRGKGKGGKGDSDKQSQAEKKKLARQRKTAMAAIGRQVIATGTPPAPTPAQAPSHGQLFTVGGVTYELPPGAQLLSAPQMSAVSVPPTPSVPPAPVKVQLPRASPPVVPSRLFSGHLHLMLQDPHTSSFHQNRLYHTSGKNSILITEAMNLLNDYEADSIEVDPDSTLTEDRANYGPDFDLFDISSPVKGAPTIMLASADVAPSEDWTAVRVLIDGGASNCAFPDPRAVHDLVQHSLQPTLTANGLLPPEGMGTSYIMLGESCIALSESKLMTGLPFGILSEEHLRELKIKLDRDHRVLRLPDSTAIPVDMVDRVPFVTCYVYIGNDRPPCMYLAAPPSKMTLNDVHDIMGCTGEDLLKKTLEKVDGLPKHVAKQTLKPCPICPAAKGKRLPVLCDPGRPPREYSLHEAVGMDISARQPPSIQGAEYVQLIIEFVSRYVVGQLLKQKSDATEAFREYIVKCFPPDLVQTDGDGAYEGEFDDRWAWSIGDLQHTHKLRTP